MSAYTSDRMPDRMPGCISIRLVRAPALSHITPPKVTSLHGHATSRKSHQVSKSHITSTQTAWPRNFTNMREDKENLVNVWKSIAQMPVAYKQVACFAHQIPMATHVSTASKGYKQIHFNVGIYIARMSLEYNQVACFAHQIPMATHVSPASKGYKQIHFNVGICVARIVGIQSSCMCFTLVPHGQAGFNSIKRIYVNPLQCWHLHCADVPSIQSDHLLFLSSNIQLSIRLREAFASLREAFARLTGGHTQIHRGTPWAFTR